MKASKDGIFGSPVEPFFHLLDNHCSADLLADNLRTLVSGNNAQMEAATVKDGYFKDGETAKLIFSICKKLYLPVEVHYLALEIFDNFMVKHVTELYNLVKTSSSADKELDWKSIDQRLKSQMLLRAASCIQIASKLTSHYKALSPSKIRRYLSSVGFQYNVSSIVRSERRILKTLNFCLTMTTPLTHVEVLLAVLSQNVPGVEVKHIYDVGVKVLDVVYLERSKLYKRISKNVGSLDWRISHDNFLLATCVIVASAYIIDDTSNDKVIEQMSMITRIDEAEIVLFSTNLVKVALDA